MSGPNRRGYLRGFTLIELLVVVSIIMILAGLLSVAAFAVLRRARSKAAKADIESFVMALSIYQRDLGAYPPDDAIPEQTWDTGQTPEHRSNEALVYHLTRKLKKGLNWYGPYLALKKERLRDDDNDGFEEYRDPFGNLYLYAENASFPGCEGRNPKSYVIVSPGEDGKLGGTFDTTHGYRDATTDLGKAEEADNITNWSR